MAWGRPLFPAQAQPASLARHRRLRQRCFPGPCILNTRAREPQRDPREHPYSQGQVADPSGAWKNLLSSLMSMKLGALTDGLALQAGAARDLDSAPLAQVQQPALDALNNVFAELRRHRAVRGDLAALDVIVAVATITRPQVSPIRGAAPGVPEQLADAYLHWSLGVS